MVHTCSLAGDLIGTSTDPLCYVNYTAVRVLYALQIAAALLYFSLSTKRLAQLRDTHRQLNTHYHTSSAPGSPDPTHHTNGHGHHHTQPSMGGAAANNHLVSSQLKDKRRCCVWWLEDSALMAVTGVITPPVLIMMGLIKIANPWRCIASDWLVTIVHFFSHSLLVIGTTFQSQFMVATIAKWDQALARTKQRTFRTLWFSYASTTVMLIPPLVSNALGDPSSNAHKWLAVASMQTWAFAFFASNTLGMGYYANLLANEVEAIMTRISSATASTPQLDAEREQRRALIVGFRKAAKISTRMGIFMFIIHTLFAWEPHMRALMYLWIPISNTLGQMKQSGMMKASIVRKQVTPSSPLPTSPQAPVSALRGGHGHSTKEPTSPIGSAGHGGAAAATFRRVPTSPNMPYNGASHRLGSSSTSNAGATSTAAVANPSAIVVIHSSTATPAIAPLAS